MRLGSHQDLDHGGPHGLGTGLGHYCTGGGWGARVVLRPDLGCREDHCGRELRVGWNLVEEGVWGALGEVRGILGGCHGDDLLHLAILFLKLLAPKRDEDANRE